MTILGGSLFPVVTATITRIKSDSRNGNTTASIGSLDIHLQGQPKNMPSPVGNIAVTRQIAIYEGTPAFTIQRGDIFTISSVAWRLVESPRNTRAVINVWHFLLERQG
jgi:hypothetical protein